MLRTLAPFVASVLVLAGSALAAPTALTSSVTRASLEPAVVVVPASAGKTTLERYRNRTAKPVSGTPLVVIVRLPDANSPDVVAVKDAQRDGTKIKVAIETRKFDGPLAGNVVTTPLVEIALGDLPPSTYTIEIGEQILHFTKYDAPQTASNPHRGLESSITLTVQ